MSITDILPPELISLVAEVVERRTLPALRLTSQTLCHHATPFLFRDLDCWLQKGSLKKLVRIASFPHLAKHVRHISCGTEEFYNVNFDVFKRSLYRDWRDPNAEYAESEQRASYHVYKKYWRRQSRLRYTDTDVSMLAVALACFTALTSIDITDHFDPYSKTGGDPPKFLEQRSLLHPRMLTPVYAITPRGGHQLGTVLRALDSAGTVLQSLSLVLNAGEVGGSESLLCALDHEEMRLAQAAFMGLKEFHLSIPVMHSSAHEREPDDEMSLTTILRTSRNLEHLHLELCEADCRDQAPGPSFRDLFGTSKFPRLQELTIENLIVSEGEFRDCLLLSCPELRELRVYSARLTKGSWSSLFKHVRRLSGLETVELSCLRYDYAEGCFFTMLFGNQDQGPLCDYLCGRSDVDPWPDMVKKERDYCDEQDRLDEEEDSLGYRDCTEMPGE